MNDADTPARRNLLITLALLALLLCWEAGAWDMTLARWYGDASGFALRDHWLLRRVLHDGGRWLSALALLGVAAWSALGDARVMARRRRWAWSGVVLLCLVAVPAIKRLSSTSCPWDLDDFGGTAMYVPHWMLTLVDGGPGHCFPSGHAVAAFAFLPLFFRWAQLARDAHFPSHTMWSAWLCWALGATAARWLGAESGTAVGTGHSVAMPSVLPARY
jgi:membrane-associated PAP2 superfamily phosphatase